MFIMRLSAKKTMSTSLFIQATELAQLAANILGYVSNSIEKIVTP